MTETEKKLSFKQKMMIQREAHIIETVNGLLATKGYEAMTVDEIAETVGIAKASLYRHFSSKEALAVAALIDTMQKGLDNIEQINTTDLGPLDKLKHITKWAMQLKLAQQMPNLPSEDSKLREHLLEHDSYMDLLVTMSDSLGVWIEEAQAKGQIDSNTPALVVLYTLYAKACDPVLGFLKTSGMYEENEIIDLILNTCFNGICA